MAIDPKPKGVELVHNIVLLKGKDLSEIQFQVSRYKNEAQALIPYSPGVAHLSLGMLYALQGNYQKMGSHFKAAIRIMPLDPVPYYNYANSLGDFSQHNESLEVFFSLLNITNTYKKSLVQIISYLEFTGRFSEVFKYFESLKKFDPDNSKKDDMAKLAIRTLKKLNITEECVTKQSKLFESFLLSNNIKPVSAEIGIAVEEGIYYEYFLNEPIQKIEELQEQLNDLIWEKGLSKILKNKVVIDLYPAKTSEEDDQEVDEAPQKAIPIDINQMDRISKLIEGVEL